MITDKRLFLFNFGCLLFDYHFSIQNQYTLSCSVRYYFWHFWHNNKYRRNAPLACRRRSATSADAEIIVTGICIP
jgi:hypothetical protein